MNNPRYGPLTLDDGFESMEQAKNAAQDAKTARDLRGRPWYTSVSVKDLGPVAGRLRYGLYYREVYHDNPRSENPSVWYYVERNGRAIGRFRSRHEAVAYEQEDRAKRKGRELPGGNEYRIMEVQDLRYDNPPPERSNV